MALEGSLQDFGLADILQLIYFQRKTGVLALEGRMDKVKLLFIEGNIVGAESKRRIDENRLGKILVKKNIIKEADLRVALQEQRTSGTKLGSIMISKEMVQKELIQDILRNQINETVTQLFGWKQGTYAFEAQGVPQDKDFQFSLDTQHLLMEGLRIMDEWSLIKGKVTLDMVFVRKTESPPSLAEEEKEIFAYVDGENDVSTIVDLTGQDNFEVSKTLIALMEKGIIMALQEVPVAPMESVKETGRPMPALRYAPLVALLLAFGIVWMFPLTGTEDIFKEIGAARQIKALRFKIESYRLEHNSYPQTLEVVSQAADPWGRPYIYRNTDTSFALVCSGADGTEGTADDIL